MEKNIKVNNEDSVEQSEQSFTEKVKTYFSGKRVIRIGAGLLIGGFLGFLYYKLVGCSTGGCPITSNPVISTLYGSMIGFLISSV